MEAGEFTVLENTTIGRNIALFRKIRDKKAIDIANYIGISEAAFTRYERGESKITVEVIQKVAEFLKVDPLQLLAASPSNFVENVHNSPFAIHGSFTTYNEEHTRIMLRLMENIVALNEKLVALLDTKNKNEK
jgi:transcriptional regulator with XRE-family HTH domain